MKMARPPYNVVVAHPTISAAGNWIDDFVEDSSFTFKKVEPFKATSSLFRRWIGRLGMGWRAYHNSPDVVVANFPHLALSVAFWKMVMFRRTKIVAWSYNIPPLDSRIKRFVIAFLSRRIDLMVPHSRVETEIYSSFYGIPRHKLVFVPFQRGRLPEAEPFEPVEKPYLIAMGSMSRDYRTLADAMRGSDLKLLLIADQHALKGVRLPPNVGLRNGISYVECCALTKSAEAMVLPIASKNTASGHITLLTAMMLGVPVIATRCDSIADYVTDGDTALTVPPEDPVALRDAMERVAEDPELRAGLAQRAHSAWKTRYSDEAAGRNLAKVLHLALNGSGEALADFVPEGY
ncbi:glycosyltransferase family 4 protein [Tropicimonas sp. IMCC6043]|uniref:glycosyltransferase family 4 protein n=1 Tax=Tropicimonas sp. IMCC6043 TaxID=2510645 RepID=UPI00101BEA70|nr:glycosyltransferase family 4 protein [Tropicimonas sp. IMCC6043]RYH09296.1 glycosyltransferase [Tropicimonas sp. IMCC6043]